MYNKVIEVNEKLRDILGKDIQIIEHSNIESSHLNNSSIHLNKKGDGKLAYNLIQDIKTYRGKESYSRNWDNIVLVPFKSKSILGYTNTESVNNGGISKNHDMDDTHKRLINFAGGVSEGIPVESTEIRREVHKTGFKTMALNIFSLMPHLDELRIFVSEQRPHIICITETKIDSTIDNSHIEIDDYVVVRNDRNRHGGGVVMYIHKTVNHKLREDLAFSEIESISIQVKVGNYKPFIVTSVYRPPEKPVEYFNELDKLLNSIDHDAEDKETIYLGDTNCDMLDCTNNDTKNLMRLLTKFNLVQLIKSPTSTTATTKTVIDHIITNRPASVSKSGVLSCGISDHDAVFMKKRMRLPKLKAPPKHLNVRN